MSQRYTEYEEERQRKATRRQSVKAKPKAAPPPAFKKADDLPPSTWVSSSDRDAEARNAMVTQLSFLAETS